jgi:hypothetical protein
VLYQRKSNSEIVEAVQVTNDMLHANSACDGKSGVIIAGYLFGEIGKNINYGDWIIEPNTDNCMIMTDEEFKKSFDKKEE